MSKIDLTEASVLIVGANGALAKETIKWLIRDGASKIVMGVRTESKGLAAKDEILEATGHSDVRLTVVRGFDMNDPGQITDTVESMSSDYSFDIIFLAAGFAVFTDTYQEVHWNGRKVEKNVFQNMLGSHFTYLALQKHGMINRGARVVLAGRRRSTRYKGND